jgi:CheY-like chemotaxis protein
VPLTLLLVEDNPVNQRVALRMLERLGYRADLASDGRAAVEAVATRAYDVILMDVQMPLMDGLEASRRIRQLPPPVRQPQINAMTANVMKGDREACLDAGMDDYIGKPVRVEELVAVLQKSGTATVSQLLTSAEVMQYSGLPLGDRSCDHAGLPNCSRIVVTVHCVCGMRGHR